MRCPSGISPRTVRNFPIQSTGAEILHVACIMAENRGLEVVAPVHDALMIEADARQAEEAAAALDQVMRDASATVLRGYELPSDKQIVEHGKSFFDKRGAEMWETISRLVAKLEKKYGIGRWVKYSALVRRKYWDSDVALVSEAVERRPPPADGLCWRCSHGMRYLCCTSRYEGCGAAPPTGT